MVRFVRVNDYDSNNNGIVIIIIIMIITIIIIIIALTIVIKLPAYVCLGQSLANTPPLFGIALSTPTLLI